MRLRTTNTAGTAAARDGRRPVGIDLFSGVGGMSLGFEEAGFDIAVALEYDPVHAAIHEFNFPLTTVICGDANHVTPETIRDAAAEGLRRLGRADWDGQIDVIFGGPPCQGFSTIGKRRLDDERNSLVSRFATFVRTLRPNYFVMENVPGMAAGGHASILTKLRGQFGPDYVVLPHRILNAADYGAPQDRKRLILIGHRRDRAAPGYPWATVQRAAKRAPIKAAANPEPVLLHALPAGPTVWDAIGDLPDLDSFRTLLDTDEVRLADGKLQEMESKSSLYARRLRGLDIDPGNYGYRRVWDRALFTSSMRTVHTFESIRRFKLTKGGETEDISRFYRLDPLGLCNTLRAGSGSERGAFTSPRPLHPRKPRVISVREAARLHGFPDWFRFNRTKWNGFRQIGNAVPPPLARAIAGQILSALGIVPTRPHRSLRLGDERLLDMNRLVAAAHFEADLDRIPKTRKRLTPEGRDAAFATG
ncbi:MAG: DNA cytosine methyltransferase [Candidatus Eremiobacteraeota bacterium]|nr:DNA cytosine methyltransferase [Candidatus Eremiobacteraeota bacterium]